MTKETLCPFFKTCGGCLYQDLPDEVYLSKKQSFITRAFSDYGINISLEPIIRIPLASRRRATFAFQKSHLGYNAHKSHQIVDITECRLLKPEIIRFLPTLKNWVKTLNAKGDISILLTPFGLDIHIKTTDKSSPDLARLEQLSLFATDPNIVRLSYNNTPIVDKVLLPFPPDSFLQPSNEGEEALIRLLLSQVDDVHKAIDLFCGGGTFTKPLLDKGIRVTGYDCAENVRILGCNGVMRDLFRSPVLAEEMTDLDLIVLDPPRAGAKTQIEQIALTDVPKVVMISCNPATAARDTTILTKAGWQLQSVTPVDQFTWSNHIELFCVLVK